MCLCALPTPSTLADLAWADAELWELGLHDHDQIPKATGGFPWEAFVQITLSPVTVVETSFSNTTDCFKSIPTRDTQGSIQS